jgi:hypothetical protein
MPNRLMTYTRRCCNAQWQSLSTNVAGALRVPSTRSFKFQGYSIWNMAATFQSELPLLAGRQTLP